MTELNTKIDTVVAHHKTLNTLTDRLKASEEEALREKAKWGKTLTDLTARQEGLDKKLGLIYTEQQSTVRDIEDKLSKLPIHEEISEVKKTLAALAVTITTLSGSVAVLAKQLDEETFKMDGVLFSGCKAAEPYSLNEDGSFKTIYRERCTEQKRTPRHTPKCAGGRVFDTSLSICVPPKK